jgi:hypothetical protein
LFYCLTSTIRVNISWGIIISRVVVANHFKQERVEFSPSVDDVLFYPHKKQCKN